MNLSRTKDGLLVPEGAHEEAVRDALKRHDPDLRLVPQDSDAYGQRIYKVMRWQGPDRDAQFVLFWADQYGNPYPLSMSIVDAVQLLDLNTVGQKEDADVRNAKLLAEKRKDFDYELDEMARMYDEHMLDKMRSPLFRSKTLQAARNRVRSRTKTNELKP